ncbi:MAG: large-conductance mechanosensitive channel protein MscL [Planctomycetota bacterium]
MGILSEFKAFAVKGNVIDMAVGIVIGAAFGKIVSSFVADIIMPTAGVLTGGFDLSKHTVVLQGARVADDGTDVAAVELGVGSFANSIVDFTIIAFAIFLVVRAINAAKRKAETEPLAAGPEPAKDIVLLGEIRDLLAARR